MEVKAKARYVRMSPRKVRLVIDVVRNMAVDEARVQLKFMNKRAARPVLKLLESAIANAEHNFKLNRDDLFIKEIYADQGPTLHRFRPRAFGRASAIRKRSSHISIILADKNKEIKADKVEKIDETEKSVSTKKVEKTSKKEQKVNK